MPGLSALSPFSSTARGSHEETNASYAILVPSARTVFLCVTSTRPISPPTLTGSPGERLVSRPLRPPLGQRDAALRAYVPRSFCTVREHRTTRCFLRLSLFLSFLFAIRTDGCWRKFTPSELKIRCETNGSCLVLILSRIDDEAFAESTI